MFGIRENFSKLWTKTKDLTVQHHHHLKTMANALRAVAYPLSRVHKSASVVLATLTSALTVLHNYVSLKSKKQSALESKDAADKAKVPDLPDLPKIGGCFYTTQGILGALDWTVLTITLSLPELTGASLVLLLAANGSFYFFYNATYESQARKFGSSQKQIMAALFKQLETNPTHRLLIPQAQEVTTDGSSSSVTQSSKQGDGEPPSSESSNKTEETAQLSSQAVGTKKRGY